MSRRLLTALGALGVLYIGTAVYQSHKALPPSVSMRGEEVSVPAESVRFLADRTFINSVGERVVDQEIFDEVLEMIAGAEHYVLLDMFLFNDFQGAAQEETRALAGELTTALVDAKRQHPDMEVTVVTDPINTVYGGTQSPEFKQLHEAGVRVVITNLPALRDSNPLYSALWRIGGQWWGNTPDGGWLLHPFDTRNGKVTLRSWIHLLNFKANHRKLVVADSTDQNGSTRMRTLITSANPHDGSSAHGNVAIVVNDSLWRDVVSSEQAVGDFSGVEVPGADLAVTDLSGDLQVQLLTEGAIRDRLLELLEIAAEGDSIDMAMFYLSDRRVIEALKQANQRGARVRIVLDANKDAFGRVKNGVPNRPVAAELVADSTEDLEIRWCETHGEQCHAKLTILKIGDAYYLLAGSANFTRRNIGNYNLETNVLLTSEKDAVAISDARDYFDEIWNNSEGRIYTADYSVYADDSRWKTLLYRIQEASGLGSF